ncbi:MAG: glycosidase [Calditrichaeota bacterium]|nr:glycosidase [Calditrichota bacterium]
MRLERIKGPILEPLAENSWESRAVLNPATIREGDVIHMLYRAVEGENFSTIGYAKLDLNQNVIERRPEPVICRTYPYEKKGCEDPRVTYLDGKYYIFYSGYDGKEVRICAASTENFETYTKYGIVVPDVWDKDAMLFPEPVGGKIILIHRVEPNIQFAFFDNIEQLLRPSNGYWNQYFSELDKFTVMKPEFDWEANKVGAGPPPIKTEQGWVLIYHGVDKNSVYRAGVALLDLESPERVIARYPKPILEPERRYELNGDVPNVVFPEGTVLIGDELYVYYGGADKVIGLATIKMNDLLEELKKHKI